MAKYPNAYTESIWINGANLKRLQKQHPEWNWGKKEEYAGNIVSTRPDERKKMLACIDRLLGREEKR